MKYKMPDQFTQDRFTFRCASVIACMWGRFLGKPSEPAFKFLPFFIAFDLNPQMRLTGVELARAREAGSDADERRCEREAACGRPAAGAMPTWQRRVPTASATLSPCWRATAASHQPCSRCTRGTTRRASCRRSPSRRCARGGGPSCARSTGALPTRSRATGSMRCSRGHSHAGGGGGGGGEGNRSGRLAASASRVPAAGSLDVQPPWAAPITPRASASYVRAGYSLGAGAGFSGAAPPRSQRPVAGMAGATARRGAG